MKRKELAASQRPLACVEVRRFVAVFRDLVSPHGAVFQSAALRCDNTTAPPEGAQSKAGGERCTLGFLFPEANKTSSLTILQIS